MKKIIVTIALLLVATLALSVSAFGATEADFGAETYYLGAPAKTAPALDGKIAANEYTVNYTLTEGVYYDAANEVLGTPADDKAVTSAIKVGVAYDVENLYIGFEADIADAVADAEYVISVDGEIDADVEVKADVDPETDKAIYVQADGKVVGEVVIPLVDNGEAKDYDKQFTLLIKETTFNADATPKVINESEWNVIKLTAAQKFELADKVDTITHTFVLGSEATLGTEVTVEQEPIGVPGQTNAPVTEAPTTEAPTTEPATEAPATEAPTTEAPTTEPVTEAPATEAPTTEAPAAEGGCGSSVAVMGIALVAALGTCAVVVSKKED